MYDEISFSSLSPGVKLLDTKRKRLKISLSFIKQIKESDNIMIVKRLKVFSYGKDYEHLEYRYSRPNSKVLNSLPEIIRNYYKVGLNDDFLELIKKSGLISDSPFPIPVLDSPAKGKYRPLFSADLDSDYLGSYLLYYDDGGNLYKDTGLFWKSYKLINNEEFKKILFDSLADNTEDIASLTPLVKKIQDKIERL